MAPNWHYNAHQRRRFARPAGTRCERRTAHRDAGRQSAAIFLLTWLFRSVSDLLGEVASERMPLLVRGGSTKKCWAHIARAPSSPVRAWPWPPPSAWAGRGGGDRRHGQSHQCRPQSGFGQRRPRRQGHLALDAGQPHRQRREPAHLFTSTMSYIVQELRDLPVQGVGRDQGWHGRRPGQAHQGHRERSGRVQRALGIGQHRPPFTARAVSRRRAVSGSVRLAPRPARTMRRSARSTGATSTAPTRSGPARKGQGRHRLVPGRHLHLLIGRVRQTIGGPAGRTARGQPGQRDSRAAR